MIDDYLADDLFHIRPLHMRESKGVSYNINDDSIPFS